MPTMKLTAAERRAGLDLRSFLPKSARRSESKPTATRKTRSFRLPRRRTLRTDHAIHDLTETIKDEIDRLHEIAKGKRREAAQDLVDYITLHHLEYA